MENEYGKAMIMLANGLAIEESVLEVADLNDGDKIQIIVDAKSVYNIEDISEF